MLFLSGFMGTEQTADGYIKPLSGWGIAQKTKVEEKEYEPEEEEEEEEENEEEGSKADE